jgi:hypothetical protein
MCRFDPLTWPRHSFVVCGPTPNRATWPRPPGRDSVDAAPRACGSAPHRAAERRNARRHVPRAATVPPAARPPPRCAPRPTGRRQTTRRVKRRGCSRSTRSPDWTRVPSASRTQRCWSSSTRTSTTRKRISAFLAAGFLCDLSPPPPSARASFGRAPMASVGDQTEEPQRPAKAVGRAHEGAQHAPHRAPHAQEARHRYAIPRTHTEGAEIDGGDQAGSCGTRESTQAAKKLITLYQHNNPTFNTKGWSQDAAGLWGQAESKATEEQSGATSTQ